MPYILTRQSGQSWGLTPQTPLTWPGSGKSGASPSACQRGPEGRG
jgi:hypothetical protein